MSYGGRAPLMPTPLGAILNVVWVYRRTSVDEIFDLLRKGNEIVIETAYEVVDVDRKTRSITLRNKRSGEEERHTDWWFINIKQNGFTIHIM